MNGSYNGWTDIAEEEREALGVYEASVAAVEVARVTPLRLLKAAIRVLVHRPSRRAA